MLPLLKFNRLQIEFITKFFGDLSKILFASVVVGFFISQNVGRSAFIVGSMLSVGLFSASVLILRTEEKI